MMIKLLLVDDQPAVRQGLRMSLALEPDFVVIGEAGNGVAALKQAHDLRPDVVVMDIEMPRMDGMAATEALHTIAPDAVVVILTIHDNAVMRARAQEAGAAAFVAKQAGIEALFSAIRQVSCPPVA